MCFLLDLFRGNLRLQLRGLVLLIGFGIHWFAALDFESAFRSLVWWMPCALFATVALPVFTRILVRKTQREQPWNSLVLD